MTFQPRFLENGTPCCTDKSALCPKCAAHNSYAPPDPYIQGIRAWREAEAKVRPESRFEEQYKAERLAALQREYDKFEQENR